MAQLVGTIVAINNVVNKYCVSVMQPLEQSNHFDWIIEL